MFFTLILSVFLTFTAHADDDCSTVNLTEANKIYSGIPVYDQVGAQICFAYTASQLIEGQRVLRGHKYTQESSISPLSLAISLAIENNQTNLQAGGVACKAIEHARENAICPSGKGFTDDSEVESYIALFNKCLAQPTNKLCEPLKQSLGTKAKAIFAQKNPLVFVQALEELKCKDADKIKLDIPKCSYENDESLSSEHFKKSVDDVFDSAAPRPVEIAYSMNLISYSGNEKKSYIIERKKEPDVTFFSLKYKPHSSILLGRKKGANGQCQYLLRNTQGPEFCPLGIVEPNGWECDTASGGIWINSTELFQSIFQVSYILEK
jgi:hypothetical protein